MKPKYNITVEISATELHTLIALHANQINKSQWYNKGQQHHMQQSAERMSALLEILKKQKE